MRKSVILGLLAVLVICGIVLADPNDRIPFCKSLTVAAEANAVILTVPDNQQFVLLKLYADYANNYNMNEGQNWHLDIDSEVLLAGTITSRGGGAVSGMSQTYQRYYIHDFPDSCVVVPTGKTLIAVNKNATGYKLNLTLIGYFKKIDILLADLNNDHKVDFADFAILASEWLDCNLDPAAACQG